jgi:hypothetical protein
MSVPCGLIVATDSATNTLRFLSQHLSDYSELPAEIIQITMRHVADPDGETTTVSTHLFKARLVCKTFSKAAVVVLLSLTRSHHTKLFQITPCSTTCPKSRVILGQSVKQCRGTRGSPHLSQRLSIMSLVHPTQMRIDTRCWSTMATTRWQSQSVLVNRPEIAHGAIRKGYFKRM